MKKFLIALVVLLALLFYTFVTTYTFSIYNTSDGYVLSDSTLREQLFTSDAGVNIKANEVKAGEGIYTRGKTIYFGDKHKVKVNTAFPLYVKNGEAIQLLSGNETLITTEYEFRETFKYSILSNGRLFNESYQEADAYDYLLVHLTNNLYVNTKEIYVSTVLHEYTIPENSIIYFNSEYIRYYRYFEGEFIYDSIIDVDYESVISADETEELSYKDFLLKLGEIVEYTNSENTGRGKKETDDDFDNKTGQQKEPIKGKPAASSGGGSSKPEKVEGNKPNDKADDPAPPEEPDPSEEPGMDIKYPDWEMPTVSLNDTFNPGVYTLKVGLDVHDPAGVIARGVSFYIYYEDEINKGKEATSQLIKTSDGTITGIINNLVPDSEYSVRASFRYYDEYGRIQDEVVVIDSREFRTKTLADLGAIEFDDMNATSNLYDKKVQVDNIKFKETSDQDAVGSLFLVTVRTYEGTSIYGKEAETSEGFTSGSQKLASLSSYEAISYITPEVLKSSTDYLVNIECRDRYGNVIVANNDTVLTRTCKSLPLGSLSLTNPLDDHGNIIVSSVIINNVIKNSDAVEYDNLRIRIVSSTGEVFRNGDLDYFPITENQTLRIDDLTLAEKFNVSLLCDADNDDGKGRVARTLDMQSLSTYFDYGSIYLTGVNLIKTEYKDYSADRFVFTLKINDARTNTQLTPLIEEFYFTISDDKGNVYATHYLTDTELTKFKNFETLTFDSYEFMSTKLPSNTTFNINFTDVRHENDKVVNDPISSTLSMFTTSKLKPKCYATNVQGFAGYLAADLMTVDVDDYIEGNNVLVRVRDKSTNKIIGSFSFPKNDKDYYELRLFSDAASSPDGMTYDIEGNAEYIVTFVAEEVTNSTETYVTLDSFVVSTAAGVTGNIYLTSLDGDGLYEELEYIESNGKQYINTFYIITSNKVRYEWDNIDMNASGSTTLFGSEINGINPNVNYSGLLYGNANSRSMYAGYNAKSLNYKTDTTSRNQWVLDLNNGKSELYKNGTKLGNNTYTGELNKWGYLYLFCNNYRNSASQYSTQRMYSFRMYDNDELVLDLVPARNKYTNETGMFDLVSQSFLHNNGTADFISGPVVTSGGRLENTGKVRANLNIEIKDDEEWLFSKTVLVDVYKNNDKTGNSSLVDTLSFEYSGKGTYNNPNDETSGVNPIQTVYNADVLSDDSYYFLKLYIKLDNGSVIPISNVSFRTNESIREIDSIDDLYNLCISKGKYVVTRNLYINATTHDNTELMEYSPDKPYDTTRGTWNQGTKSPWYSSSHYLYAQIDFQGFTLEYHGYSYLFNRLELGSKISNIVYKSFAYYTRATQNTSASDSSSYDNNYAGNLTYNAYGTIENAYVEMYQEDISDKYLYDSYWCDYPDGEGVTHYDYFKVSNFISCNYGTLTNFIVNFKTTYVSSCYGGVLAVNRPSGIVKNGYIYSDLYGDEEHGYNYKAQMYAYSAYNNAVNWYNSTAGITCANQGGMIQNVYCLADIYCKQYSRVNYEGISACYNYNGAIVKNTYTIGNVLRNGEPNNANYGPNIGVNAAAVRYLTDDYFISDYTYNATRNSNTDNTMNRPTGYVALKDIEWQTKVLNSNGNTFEIESLINAGYYPHLNFTSNCMPSQDFIPIPTIKKTDTDVTLSYEYEWGINTTLDAELKEDIRKLLGADFDFDRYLGDLMWDEKDENGFNSQVKVEVVFVVNKSLTPVYGLEMSNRDMVVRTLKEHNDGSGITQCYSLVYNPNSAVNSYKITGVQWTDIRTGGKGSTSTLKDTNDNDITRDLDISFYRALSSIDGDDSWQNLRANTKENFRLFNDLDFSGYDIDKIFVYNYFEGVLDGNGHTIKNVELSEGQFIDYYYNQSYQGTNAQSLSETAMRSDYTSAAYVQKTGIFSTIYGGTIKNTVFENINIESGFYAGAICGYAYGALFDNVFVNDAYVVGTMSTGGFVGMASGSEISDSGINNAKIMSVTGSSYSSSMSYADPNRTGSMAGGLIGYGHTATKINRSYANNIYIENFTSDMNYGFTGGIVGGMNDSTAINGAYATGVIISGSRATGGIIGQVDTQDIERFDINNCYSDVDILGYNGSVGGLIGDSKNSFGTEGKNVVFGDVICNTKMDDYTVIRQKYSLITGYKNGLAAYTCDSANLVISESEKSTGTSFSKSIINSSLLYDYGYFSNEYFVTSSTNGVLPKLLGKNNQILPYQNDVYIDLNASSIILDTVNSYSYDNSTSTKNSVGYQFGFNIDSTITINDVYFDYSYVDDYLGLPTNNIMDSMTLHTPFKGGRASDSTSSTYYMITYDDADIKSYYDYYRITAIKFTKTNSDGTTSTHYQKLNQLLNISPKTMKVSSLNDWDNVANSRAENILITNNINFNKVYKYTDKNINIIANRLCGPDSKIALSNVTINGGYDFSTNKGYLYDFATSFIRVTLSELKNITFDNISVERSRLCGVVHEVRGIMQNVDFTNCYIGESAISYSWMPYGSGLVNYCSANVSDIYVDNCNVICPSAYGVGILFGAVNENFYSYDFKNVTIENSTSSGTSYVGGFTGFIHNFSCNSSGETYAYYDNVVLRNSTVTGSTNYIGGIIGYVYYPHYMHFLKNSLIDNCLIQSTTSGYVGGMIGYSSYIIYPSNNTVYKSTIKGVNRVGGFAGSGYIYPNSDTYTFNNTVRDCQVVGTGDYTAGALAYATYGAPSATYKTDRTIYDNPETTFYRYYVVNTEVLGNQYVAGVTAHADNNYNYFPNNVVDNCTIKGNRVVGGIFGYGQQIALSSIVRDSYIGSYDNAAEASRYGIAYAPDNRFGGIGGAEGGYANCIVQNCIIGGRNINEVGGLSGAATMTRQQTLPELTNTMCKDCIVIGKDLVGGLFGSLGRSDVDQYANATNLYSNASVYANNHAGGIAGQLIGRQDSSTKLFLYMPTVENVYFTGTLNSENYASLLYGKVVGNTTLTCNWLRYVSSLPKSITCKTFTPFFAEDDEYSYTWSNLINVETNTSNMLVSFYGGTVITDQFGSKTLSDILTSTSSAYLNYCYDDNDIVSFGTSTNAGKFIRVYNTSEDIASKFHAELINPAKSTLATSYRYVGFKTTDVDNYMPLIVAYDTSTKVIFVNPNTNDMQPVTGLTITNKATGDSTYYEAMQGVYVTGNTLYDAQLEALDIIYETYTVSGAAACGIGSNGAVGVPTPYDDGIYYRVEYLASTSKQYIDTGYKLSTGYSFDFEWQIDYQTDWFFGANSGNYEMILGRKTSNYFGTKYRGFSYSWIYGEKSHIRMDLANGSTNSQLYENDYLICDVTSAFNNKELYLFGVISVSSATTCDAMKTMRYYYFDIYQGNNKVMAMVPVVTESGLGGMYDTIGHRFYPSETETPFFYGKKLSDVPINDPPMIMATAPKALNNITAYASGVDTLNIEFSTQYANSSKDKNPYIIICDNNDNVLINKETITNFTYSINYDFDTVLKVKYGYDGSKENSYTIDPVQVSNHVMLTDNNTYAIYNHKLYINDVVNNTISYPLHLDNGLCIDKYGDVYNVSSMNIISGVNGISKANSVTPLYTFNYDSKDIYTYVYRTVVSTNSSINVQDGIRSFVAYGNLISISTNNDVGVDPLYVKYKDGKDYTILLKNNSLYSIGDSDMISKFTGFTNEGIKAISSNIGISSTNKNLLVEYKDGNIVDINTETGKATTIGETIIEKDTDVISFLSNSLTSMFSMPTTTSYNLTNNRIASNTVIDYMDNAGASIPDVVNLINDNDVENIADTVMLGTTYGIGNSGGSDQVGIPEDGKINEGEGSESTETIPSENENPTNNDLETMVSLIDSNVKEEDKPIIANYDEVLVDTAKKALNNPTTLNSNKAKDSEFISVYNADTDSFEIYNEEELLTEESAESIDSRIVDKTKLKALYEELGEANDKSTTRGLVLYGIIALVIIMLIALLGAFKNKPKF